MSPPTCAPTFRRWAVVPLSIDAYVSMTVVMGRAVVIGVGVAVRDPPGVSLASEDRGDSQRYRSHVLATGQLRLDPLKLDDVAKVRSAASAEADVSSITRDNTSTDRPARYNFLYSPQGRPAARQPHAGHRGTGSPSGEVIPHAVRHPPIPPPSSARTASGRPSTATPTLLRSSRPLPPRRRRRRRRGDPKTDALKGWFGERETTAWVRREGRGAVLPAVRRRRHDRGGCVLRPRSALA
jgi:hypothetical protein